MAGRVQQAGGEGVVVDLSDLRLIRRHGARPRYAVGLTRVSTAEQGSSGLSLEAHSESIRRFVASQGWVLVAEYADVASGKDDRRPGFQAALARCRQLGAVLVAARLDRITRRAHTLSQLLEEGLAIRAADMPGADDLMTRVYAAMAQQERELIGQSVVWRLTKLYRATDRLRRPGAAVKNLAHSASFHAAEKEAPPNPGIKHHWRRGWQPLFPFYKLKNLHNSSVGAA